MLGELVKQICQSHTSPHWNEWTITFTGEVVLLDRDWLDLWRANFRGYLQYSTKAALLQCRHCCFFTLLTRLAILCTFKIKLWSYLTKCTFNLCIRLHWLHAGLCLCSVVSVNVTWSVYLCFQSTFHYFSFRSLIFLKPSGTNTSEADAVRSARH